MGRRVAKWRISANNRAENVCFLVVFIAAQSLAILIFDYGDNLLEDVLVAFVLAVIARGVSWLAFGRRRQARP
jgi:hypothetical protein